MPSLSTYATGQHAASMDSLHGNGQFNEEGTAISLHCVEATQCSNQGAILPLITAGTFEAREIFEDPGECNSIVSQHSAAADTALHYQYKHKHCSYTSHVFWFHCPVQLAQLWPRRQFNQMAGLCHSKENPTISKEIRPSICWLYKSKSVLEFSPTTWRFQS